MERFCTKCGKPLDANGHCECSSGNESGNVITRFLSSCMSRMGLGCNDNEENVTLFERNRKIVPNVVKPNDGEIPIKQYDIAILRSRILGKRAEGKLQITNKRVIFRAPGISYTGKITLQHEFALEEVGGIEIKKSNRLSFINLLLGMVLSTAVSDLFASIFNVIANVSDTIGYILAFVFSLALLVPFFVIKKKFWIKLCCTAAAVGTFTTACDFSSKVMNFMFGEKLIGFNEIVLGVITLVWLFNLILTSIAPDLRICIKTKSAGEAIQIRKKVWGFITRQLIEYTDFSEVLPWKDTDKAITEIGAIIDDIQTMGDMAIDKWKEN